MDQTLYDSASIMAQVIALYDSASIMAQVIRLQAYAAKDKNAIRWLVAAVGIQDPDEREAAVKVLLCSPKNAREVVKNYYLDIVRQCCEYGVNVKDVMPEWLEACYRASQDEDIAPLLCELGLAPMIQNGLYVKEVLNG